MGSLLGIRSKSALNASAAASPKRYGRNWQLHQNDTIKRHTSKKLLALLLVISTTLSAQKIEIKSDFLYVDSKKFTKSTTSKELQSVLGKPDKKFKKISTIWTYDNLGLRIYLNPTTLLVESVEFDFVKGDFDFSPKNVFHGIFTINNSKIINNTSIDELTKIKDINFHHSVLDLYTATTSYITLTFQISDENYKIQWIALSFKE